MTSSTEFEARITHPGRNLVQKKAWKRNRYVLNDESVNSKTGIVQDKIFIPSDCACCCLRKFMINATKQSNAVKVFLVRLSYLTPHILLQIDKKTFPIKLSVMELTAAVKLWAVSFS